MSGNQSWAMKMYCGIAIIADAYERVIDRRIEKNYLDQKVYFFDEAIKIVNEAKEKKEPTSIAIVGNAADVFEEAYEKEFMPDVISEMCPCHEHISYIPSGYTDEYRSKDRMAYLDDTRKIMIRHLKVMNKFYAKGVEVFEYGTSIRKECRDAGMPEEEAMIIPGFVSEYIRPLFCEGRGPFRWTCMSGDAEDAEDLKRTDDLALEICKGDPLVERWIKLARANLPIEGLPARICYMGFGQRRKFGLAVNELIKKGEIKGPVAFSRDNLDSGSIVNPIFESENMKDGGDLISGCPYLNALLNLQQDVV